MALSQFLPRFMPLFLRHSCSCCCMPGTFALQGAGGLPDPLASQPLPHLPPVSTISLWLETVIAYVFSLVYLLTDLPRSRRFSDLLEFPGLSPPPDLCLQMDTGSGRWPRPSLRWEHTERQVLCMLAGSRLPFYSGLVTFWLGDFG